MIRKRILIVCQWPLGGIRTYLKYNYRQFPRDRFEITILANPAIEKDALAEDMAQLGIEVVWAEPWRGHNVLFRRVRQLLKREPFDLIHSQGFISAVHSSIANRTPHVPHVMTMHGVLEEKRFAGLLGGLKKGIFERLMKRVDVLVGVGDDILQHVRSGLPSLNDREDRWVTIRNGIDPAPFLKDYPDARADLRRSLDIPDDTFVFGYFGRFMPEKGFNFLLDAVREIVDNDTAPRRFVLMAVGSGDYESKYRGDTTRYGLDDTVRFRPFEREVAALMQGCDCVVMPSIWEAYPLLTSEVLCCGIPIIATDCVGLREAVADTPAISVPAGDSSALAPAMTAAMENSDLAEPFRAFRDEAGRRYDVRHAAEKLVALFDKLTGVRGAGEET